MKLQCATWENARLVNYSRSGSPNDRSTPSSEATLFAFRFQFPSAFTGRPTNGSLWKITPHQPQFSDFILWILQTLLRNKRQFALLFIGRSRIAGKVEITW